ncbi:MAG: thiamine pyrophosphate-dependent enzyme [Sorangiineae bacterium]|nr:thiamine pyrophosphate-dependent enzyme [Polyangiaceae bacterium]MEB2324282.1 thiamine pyrophosphate-dependent enzyme [Sorangiineae bacterium]
MNDASAAEHDPLLGLFRVLRDDGRTDPATDPFLAADVLLRMYRELRRVRVLETRMVALQRQGRIGFYGSCTGQEATPIATAFALDASDWVFPALRESAIMLVRGFPLTKYLAQVFGNDWDVLKGRQMPSHMSAREVNQVSWSSVIAPQIPQAVGAAMAAKHRGDSVVTVGFLGDGATSQPDFHNAMNFAGVFKAPCIIICQNNHWSISVPTAKQTASRTLAVKARAYGVRGLRVDGNDVLAVYAAVSRAAAQARAGEGPTFLECVTYRMGAHSTSDDPTRYRSEEEVREWAKKDPILRFRRHLAYLGVIDDAADERIDRELDEEISAAIAAVEPRPMPPREWLFDDVYEERPWHLEDERRELLAAAPAPSH